MGRAVTGLLGALTALFPDEIIDLFEVALIKNPDECTRKQLASTGVQVEGIVVFMVSRIGGRPYAWLMNVTGLFGAFLLVFPRRYREIATVFLYEETESVEWTDQFTTVIRVIGGVYILLAVRAFKRRRASNKLESIAKNRQFELETES